MKAKVSIVRCRDYNEKDVRGAVRQALTLIGGLGEIVKKGSRILVKPNMLSAKPPESGVDTHPAVVQAVVELLKEEGAEVLIGDSPGGIIKNGLSYYWEISGYKKISEMTGAKLVSLEENSREISVPHGVIYQKLYIPAVALEVDAIITLPKLKTHDLTLYTGAVKNLMGLIPGLGKAEIHKRCPKPDDFGEALADIFSVMKPVMAILDAVVGMEGNGPVHGKLRDIGVILASKDSVALDTIAQAMIGLAPFDVPTTKAATKRSLGVSGLKEIEVLGESLEEVSIDDFILPLSARLTRRIPGPILSLIARQVMVKPVPLRKKCTRCLICRENCPVDAISLTDGYPRINYHKCILCLCCRELCPEDAISIRKSLLARRIFR
ncbi:DUF362 domain-containing protein [candidate division NPL-UPA2 bacterium Unc8]|uniref:DUF362 domain-containing protein n=1 Tax=candidate division NPL-UPA2 bacterium Unc8 TaxID=1980939 RepID=A0A399FW79_UNCN2|nr:NAD(P)H-quinone oxidoreductase subunit I, chloroplastic [Bacillota bacterium]MBT9137588.1 NAD(P)H-quinone oxidoreductase subunit I, chloroplastic [Bacillota bacterium]MBT9146837.1 NAD(P)H-quinone oxidoreductase subunit I, chloroplastic [Bacillota bacterium]RII00421.1 MAG: DUF362 domain-containing protein [candidate division NPL-UPA2 bacterium Unc8]